MRELAPLETVIARFCRDYPDEPIEDLRRQAAMLLAFAEDADDDGYLPERTLAEWGLRQELILIRAGYNADGSL